MNQIDTDYVTSPMSLGDFYLEYEVYGSNGELQQTKETAEEKNLMVNFLYDHFYDPQFYLISSY